MTLQSSYAKQFYHYALLFLIILFLILCNPPKANSYDKFRHPYYELKGDHKKMACSKCHEDSDWQENTKCINCHEVDIPQKTSCTVCHDEKEGVKTVHYEKHFGRHCAFCHESGNWQPPISAVPEPDNCIQCHEEDVPQNHYPIKECYLCHTGAHWSQHQFDHKGFRRCERCHPKTNNE